MRGALPILLALPFMMAACGNATPQGQADAGAARTIPASDTSAYIIISTRSLDAGWDALEAMNTELPAAERAKIQARGPVSGKSTDMMIRFGGRCANEKAFTATAAVVAARHGATGARCVATLPES